MRGYQKRLTDPRALDQLNRYLIPGALGQVFPLLSPEDAGLSIDMVRPACRGSIFALRAQGAGRLVFGGGGMPGKDR